MNQGLFITATGTGVGKTVITAGIVRWLRSRGIDAVPVKSIQTGGVPGKDGLVAPDLDFCLSTAGMHPSRHEMALMTPYIYEPACSPHLAGRIKRRYPEIPHIQACLEQLLAHHEIVVVEGVGGIKVPINEETTILNLMMTLGFPVVLVAHAGLGTINHSLLSINALRLSGLEILGVVFNEVESGSPEDDFIKKDNLETVARLGDVYVLGHVRHLAGLGPDSENLWDQFERDMPGLQKILERVGVK